MNERVVNLLSLCLTAKEQGICIWFDYEPHVDGVSIRAYKEGWDILPPDEKPDYEFSYRIYLDWENAEEELDKAEQAVLNLIKERDKTE